LRTTQEKKQSLAKQSRREIALYLEKGKLETARIKTENIINEDIYAELLELLELYCEVMSTRFGLLELPTKEPDPGVAEAIYAIVYAATRTEIKELHVLREMLMHKFGREFSLRVMENQGGCVSERITRKLVVEPPSEELVDAYLAEIARGYKVDWTPTRHGNPDSDEGGVKAAESVHAGAGDGSGQRGEGPAVADEQEQVEPAEKGGDGDGGKEDEYTALSKRFEALKSRK